MKIILEKLGLRDERRKVKKDKVFLCFFCEDLRNLLGVNIILILILMWRRVCGVSDF